MSEEMDKTETENQAQGLHSAAPDSVFLVTLANKISYGFSQLKTVSII